jgi:hypothetical protein
LKPPRSGARKIFIENRMLFVAGYLSKNRSIKLVFFFVD